MEAFSFKVFKKYPSLIPLVVVVSMGIGGAIFYPLRCAFKSPDVSWNKEKNPAPWNEYSNKQYKFYSTGKIDPNRKNEIPSY